MQTIDPRSSIEQFYSKELYAARPTEPGWKQDPNREKELVVRVRCIRLASGERLKFYFCIPKPLGKRELSDLERRLKAVRSQIVEMRKREARDIATRERRLIRQPRRKRRRK
jgi:hypothetical protein